MGFYGRAYSAALPLPYEDPCDNAVGAGFIHARSWIKNESDWPRSLALRQTKR